jgi:protein involved in polysaccharide export with SLBB domain
MIAAALATVLIGGIAASGAPAPQPPAVREASVRYTCRTGDRLQYRVAEDPARGSEPMIVAVNTVGEASFPVSRDSDIRVTLPVRGKTLLEVKAELRRRLLAEYYNKATVELALAEKILTPGKVQFFGEISATLQILPDTPPLYLSDAILQLNPPEFADLRRIKVHRVDPVTQVPRVIQANVRDILRNGRREEDFVLQDGDRVEVPTRWLN